MKSKIKVWNLLIALILISSLTLVACGGAEAPAPAEEAPAEEAPAEEAPAEEAPAEEEAAEEEAEPYKASIVLTVAGLGDQSFNDAAYRGLQQAESECSQVGQRTVDQGTRGRLPGADSIGRKSAASGSSQVDCHRTENFDPGWPYHRYRCGGQGRYP